MPSTLEHRVYFDKDVGNLFCTLTDENILLFAAKNYENHFCLGPKEFYSDFERLKQIRKQISTFLNSGQINERLFLNNVICFFNVFEKEAAKVMLIYKMNVSNEHLSVIKTAIKFLGFLRDDELEYIEINTTIEEKLNAL